ncbi:alpha-amylase family protein [Bdellovibrio sp. SKB1291214]|uniref:alpha-amylase n=1 Tax=Bdellovibrio sp. SKB1291214 TaxID=1732569 RepID=UPI000B519DCC|nr:alpha-amylase family protein [Bdellovibrio sp. SKB1291214]UYL09054.1 alpha-amylase family protein [Bdellovibrio sp. SKB1291214]
MFSKLQRTILFVAILLGTTSAFAAPRTVFVQLFEWPWREVARECELYLGPSGFSAVQVSPPHEHVSANGAWWERYQVVSYKMESRGGSEAEFADMVRRCNKAGVDVYADAVLNHMSGFPSGVGFAGSTFTHNNYPGVYSPNDFHYCGRNGNNNIVNYRDLYELQNCQLVGLADLATESAYVQQKMADYLNHLLDLGVSGFRLDAAKHMPSKDLAQITKRMKRSAYVFQEIIHESYGPVTYDEYFPAGDVTAYEYPFILGGSIKYGHLGNLLYIAKNLPSSDHSVVFVTNHDLERTGDGNILRYNGSDNSIYRLAQIFMLAYPYGYPQVYSGYDFNSYDQGPPLGSDMRTLGILAQNNSCVAPWTCEHRLPEVAAMVNFRNQTDKAFYVSNWNTDNTNFVSFSRGGLGFVALNFSGNSMNLTLQTGLPAGAYCNLTGPSYSRQSRKCSDMKYNVNSDGTINVNLPPYSSLVLLNRDQNKRTK